MSAVLFALACSGKQVITDYEAARDEALAPPGPPPAVWDPDAALYLTPDVVEAMIAAALTQHGALKGEAEVQIPILGRAQVEPDLNVVSMKVASSPRCPECLAIDARLDGRVGWRLRSGGGGSTTVDVAVSLDSELSTRRQPDGLFAFEARPREIRELDVKLGGVAAGLGPAVERSVREWVQAEVFDRTEPLTLGVAGSPEVPVRAARISPSSNGIAVALLTASPTPAALSKVAPKLRSGWQLEIANQSLVGLARAASFRAGPIAHDVVAEPRGLSIVPGRFRMELRLWRIKGKGWWRDYTIEGEVAITPDGIALAPTSVTEGEKSPDAAWVDPLAALAEGVILRSIEEAVHASLPAGVSGEGGGMGFDVTVRSVTSASGALRISGDLAITPAEAPRKPVPKPGGRPKK